MSTEKTTGIAARDSRSVLCYLFSPDFEELLFCDIGGSRLPVYGAVSSDGHPYAAAMCAAKAAGVDVSDLEALGGTDDGTSPLGPANMALIGTVAYPHWTSPETVYIYAGIVRHGAMARLRDEVAAQRCYWGLCSAVRGDWKNPYSKYGKIECFMWHAIETLHGLRPGDGKEG